jgi:hypothetical protein
MAPDDRMESYIPEEGGSVIVGMNLRRFVELLMPTELKSFLKGVEVPSAMATAGAGQGVAPMRLVHRSI